MPDKVLICQNCHNPFVYSEFEQQKDLRDGKPTPLYCPICTAIKQNEAKFPPKPVKNA